MITLPYSEVVTIQQPYATRIENLNPVLNFSWAGICELSPSGDEWFEVNRLPALVINREGNFDTVFAQNRNAIGTVWNAWQTQWSGTSTTRGGRFREHRFINLGQPRGRAFYKELQQLKLELELDKVFKLMLCHRLIEGLKVIEYYLLHLFHLFVQEMLLSKQLV